MSGFNSYYNGPKPILGEKVQLNKDESHHLVAVLRAKKGEKVTLFDGKGNVWKGSILEIHAKHVFLKIESEFSISKPQCSIILAQALPKGKGMEQILQKAIQIGVDKIIPLQTTRTELKLDKDREAKRMEHWQVVAIEACKQSGNFLIPELFPVQGLKVFLEQYKQIEGLKLIASLEARAQSLKEYLNGTVPHSITWVIGPEGDLTEEEYGLLYKNDFKPICLAKNVLRVETAAIYALSITDYELKNKV